MSAPLFTTERLSLYPLTAQDAVFMLALLNDPGFIQGIGDRGVRDLEGARQYIQRAATQNYERFGFGLYRVDLTRTREPVGICGLLKRDSLPDPDIGFAFLTAHFRKGYGLESARAVIHYAREKLGLKRVLGVTNPDNTASIRLLEKLGLRFEGKVKLSPDSPEGNLFGVSLSH